MLGGLCVAFCPLVHNQQDGVVIKAKTAEHRNRQARLLKAYNGGAEVPRYTRKPAAAGAAGRPAQPGQAGAAAAGV